jgi:hypothetical protein
LAVHQAHQNKNAQGAIKALLRLNAEIFVLAGTSKKQVSDVYGHSSHVPAAALDNLVSL